MDEKELDTLMSGIHPSSHPIVLSKLTRLRSKDITNRSFRLLLKELTGQLAYKAFEDLKTTEELVQTPIGQHKGYKLETKVALIPILRSGLGMVEALQELLPEAEVHHIGMFRNKESLLPVLYFNKVSIEHQWVTLL